jgi:hypothetical protein
MRSLMLGHLHQIKTASKNPTWPKLITMGLVSTKSLPEDLSWKVYCLTCVIIIGARKCECPIKPCARLRIYARLLLTG